MAINPKGQKMNTKVITEEVKAPEAEAVVAEAPAVTEEPKATEAPKVTETPKVTQAPASGVVVTSTSAPAGKEASAAFKAAVAKESTVAAPKLSAFEKKIADVMEKGTSREKGLVNFMTGYLNAMAPGKPIDEKAGAAQQGQFIRTFVNVCQHDDGFKGCMDLLIAYFVEHKDGALHERYAFRFTEYMTQSPENISAFTAMVNMFKIAASITNKREIVKHVDLSRSLNATYNEAARQRVIGYFS